MTSDKIKMPRGMQPALPDPWSVPIVVAQIPATGLERILEATAGECRRLAEAAGINSVSDLRAQFTLQPGRSDTVRIDGRLTGRVGQTCVVTLEPMESAISEAIELVFAPPEQIARLSDLADDKEDGAERPDPPEPIQNGIIDLGRVATDALFLAIDPYPRRPDAVFDGVTDAADPEHHPFAALKGLKPRGEPPGD